MFSLFRSAVFLQILCSFQSRDTAGQNTFSGAPVEGVEGRNEWVGLLEPRERGQLVRPLGDGQCSAEGQVVVYSETKYYSAFQMFCLLW